MENFVPEENLWHPIAKLAWFVINPPLGFQGEGKLEAALQELHGTAELRPAVLSLVSLAKHFDEAGEAKSAERLLLAARSAIPSLELGREEDALRAGDARRQQTAVFRQFQGRVEKTLAPHYGASPQRGSFSVASLQAKGRRLA